MAVIGECMVELNGAPFGPVHQTFGGDSLNTSLYLARLGRQAIAVQYVTAVGSDPLSKGMTERWKAEGIDTHLVLRDSARLPGLYWIQVDATGERSFLYWRGESAARYLLQHADFERVAAGLAAVDLIYLSGVSLAVLPDEDREKLLELLRRLATSNVLIAFDTNYRASLWMSPEAARTAVTALLPATRLMFATFEDEQHLWGDATPQASLARLHAAQVQSIVIKLGRAGCLYSDGATVTVVETSAVPNVIDTTAAGDAFNAGFLAAWLENCSPEECCRVGNALAGIVIQHHGAIIPASQTPALEALLAQRL